MYYIIYLIYASELLYAACPSFTACFELYLDTHKLT